MNRFLFVVIGLFALQACVSTKSKWGNEANKSQPKCDEVSRTLLINLKEKKFSDGSPQAEYRNLILGSETGKNYWDFFGKAVCDFSLDENGGRMACGAREDSTVIDCVRASGEKVALRTGTNQEFLFFLENTANELMSRGGSMPRSTLRDKIDAEISYLKLLRFLGHEMKRRKRPEFFKKMDDENERRAVADLSRIERIYEINFFVHLKHAAREHFEAVSSQPSLSEDDEAELATLRGWVRSLK